MEPCLVISQKPHFQVLVENNAETYGFKKVKGRKGKRRGLCVCLFQPVTHADQQSFRRKRMNNTRRGLTREQSSSHLKNN